MPTPTRTQKSLAEQLPFHWKPWQKHLSHESTDETPERYVFKRDSTDETPERYVFKRESTDETPEYYVFKRESTDEIPEYYVFRRVNKRNTGALCLERTDETPEYYVSKSDRVVKLLMQIPMSKH